MRRNRSEEPVGKSGNRSGVVRSAQMEGEMMGVLELLCENLCFALGVIYLHSLVD